MAQPRRIWNILLPAELHATLSHRRGQQTLTAAMANALEHLSEQAHVSAVARPARDQGSVEITLRLPIAVADTADHWRAEHGLTRQATVEYAVLTALELAS